MAARAKPAPAIDVALTDLPAPLRWREWMARVEAVIFASPSPVPREVLAQIVGRDCNLDLIIDDIRAELKIRPYDIVTVADGFQHRTRTRHADIINMAMGQGTNGSRALSQKEGEILMAIALFQPITRSELGQIFGKEVSRDMIAGLRGHDFIAFGPRSPQPGAPVTYVTTKAFLGHFGLKSLRDLPDFEALEDAGLLGKDKLLAGEIPIALASADDSDIGAEDELSNEMLRTLEEE